MKFRIPRLMGFKVAIFRISPINFRYSHFSNHDDSVSVVIKITLLVAIND